MGGYENVKKALQDTVAPELHALRVEIKRLDEKVESLSRKIEDKLNSLRNELLAEIRRVETRINSLETQLQPAIDIRERLAKVEVKIARE